MLFSDEDGGWGGEIDRNNMGERVVSRFDSFDYQSEPKSLQEYILG